MVKYSMQALDVESMTWKILWIQLRGGPPWGFRLKGGKGTEVPLFISTVNAKGRQQGLKEGDLLLSVNGQSSQDMTHAEAQRAVKESPGNLELQIQRRLPSSGSGMNGDTGVKAREVSRNSAQESSLDEDSNYNHSSWSTDSTSTGSTIIHISPNSSEEVSSGPERVWSPNTRKKVSLKLNCDLPTKSEETTEARDHPSTKESKEDDTSPVWQPFGAPYDGPQFRPVKLEVTTMSTTTKKTTTAVPQSEQPPNDENETTDNKAGKPTEKPEKEGGVAQSPVPQKESSSGKKTPETPLSSVSTTFVKSGWSSHLPPSQSPTITLLQKAREGQIPKGAIYLDDKPDSTPLPQNAVLIDQKVTVEGDKVHTDSYYAVPTLTTETTTHDIKAPPKYDGIGPTEYGIPVGLRTGVKEEYASDWYKTMYKSLHRGRYPNEPNHTVHYGGYMSEPEFDRKDTYHTKYSTVDHRRKPEKSVSYSVESPAPSVERIKKSGSESPVVRHEQRKYQVEPRSIAEYEPGRSSLAEKEFQKFWSDFWDSMDDLHEHLGDISSKPQPQGLSRRWPNVLLSDGYESDSTLIRKTGRVPYVDPEQQKAWYKEIQKGGEIPFIGLRKTAPEKPAASPHQYQETEVNIHYRSPIRHLEKEYIEEEELRKRQEDAMRKFYEEEKRKKHQQELAEMEMRRHSDFFTPSQKSPIPLNRYDNPFDTNYGNKLVPGVNRGPPPKTMARALYPFTAQTTRELSLNKGDIVYITKQIDKNWYEGEHHGLIGIFPVTYVEIIPNEKANLQPRKATEGEAIVKYNFRAQTPIELSLFKGEKVILTKRMDQNWYEGRLGMKKGIFPVSYVNVLQEPGEYSHAGSRAISPKPPASPVYSPIVNGSPPKVEGPTFNTGLRPLQDKPPLNLDKLDTKSSLTQSLHIDTYNEPIPYRSLYSYKPQNDDELELKEGDTVYVMEKCDDGWYVGTSLRTGLFGTFPGNYVERI